MLGLVDDVLFLAWCVERQIELMNVQSSKPTKNTRVEAFHGRVREECLALNWFQNLFDARRKIATCRIEYNEERPHSSIGYRTPKKFAAAQAANLNTAELGQRTQTPSLALRTPPSRLTKRWNDGTEESCRILT